MRPHLLAFAAAAIAAPLEKRAVDANDALVLNTLLYLEQMQYALFAGGCNNFTDAQYAAQGYPYGFRQDLCAIAQQEAAHITLLSGGVTSSGYAAFPTCSYNFSIITDPNSFVNIANIIKSITIGAYLGGGEYLTNNVGVNEASNAIEGVESRHDAFLRLFTGASPFPSYQEPGLSVSYAYHLTTRFIYSCPANNVLNGLFTYPRLNTTGFTEAALQTLQTPIPAGTVIPLAFAATFLSTLVGTTNNLYVAFINQNIYGPTYVQVARTSTTTGTVTVPSGLAGVVFAVLTNQDAGYSLDELTQGATLAGPIAFLAS